MSQGVSSLRLADQIGYGEHRLRKLQGERVDFLDVQTFERDEYNRTLQLSISFVVRLTAEVLAVVTVIR